MYWHIDCDMISLFATCLLIFYQRRMHPDAKEKLRSKWFSCCLFVCAAVTVIDILASVVMETPTSRFLYHFVMTLYFVSIMLVIISWFGFSLTILYESNPRRGHIVGLIAIAPYVVYAALAVSNPWTGLFFSLDKNMVYTRGPIFLMMVAVFGAYTIILFIITLLRRRYIDRRYSGAVLQIIPLLLALSIVVQLLNHGWLFILPMYSLCLLFAFFFLQADEIKKQNQLLEHLSIEAATDKLTGALNRAGAEAQVSKALADRLHPHCLLVFVDVDNLKQINDRFGHEYGDKALVAVARQLRGFFRITDIIARYGGDEFVVILLGTYDAVQIDRWLDRLHQQLSDVQLGGESGATVNASIGAAWGDARRDCVETLLHQADKALYSVKRNGKNGYAVYTPPTDEN